MKDPLIFDFDRRIPQDLIPEQFNNPFGRDVPEIGRIAALQFQDFILAQSERWDYDFETRPGKMFGVLVVEMTDNTYGYLGAVSGKISRSTPCHQLVPSLFDESVDNHFFTREMKELTLLCNEINDCKDQQTLALLKDKRKRKSNSIQQRIFENTLFQNRLNEEKNVVEIFHDSQSGNPPAAAGECGAPKLIQYAIAIGLKPITIAEFWWGNSLNTQERIHKNFYPACKSKCRPILQFLLDDDTLYEKGQLV